jgi:hypothetical protein
MRSFDPTILLLISGSIMISVSLSYYAVTFLFGW